MRKKSTIAVGTGPASVVVIVQPKQEADVETSTEEEVAAAEETIADDPNLPPCPPGIPICSRLFSPSPPPQQTSTSASTSAQLPGPPPAIPISTGKNQNQPLHSYAVWPYSYTRAFLVDLRLSLTIYI